MLDVVELSRLQFALTPSVVTFTIVLYSVFLGVTCGAGAGFGSSFLGSCGFATTGGRVGSGWRRIFSLKAHR